MNVEKLSNEVEKGIDHQLMLLGDEITMVFNASDCAEDPRGNEYQEYALGAKFGEGSSFWGRSIHKFTGSVWYVDAQGMSSEEITEKFAQNFYDTIKGLIQFEVNPIIYWRINPEICAFNTEAENLDICMDEAREELEANPNALRIYFRLSHYQQRLGAPNDRRT